MSVAARVAYVCGYKLHIMNHWGKKRSGVLARCRCLRAGLGEQLLKGVMAVRRPGPPGLGSIMRAPKTLLSEHMYVCRKSDQIAGEVGCVTPVIVPNQDAASQIPHAVRTYRSPFCSSSSAGRCSPVWLCSEFRRFITQLQREGPVPLGVKRICTGTADDCGPRRSLAIGCS